MLESLVLPSYSVIDPLDPIPLDDGLARSAKFSRVQRDGSERRLPCLCGATLEGLIREQGQVLTLPQRSDNPDMGGKVLSSTT